TPGVNIVVTALAVDRVGAVASEQVIVLIGADDRRGFDHVEVRGLADRLCAIADVVSEDNFTEPALIGGIGPSAINRRECTAARGTHGYDMKSIAIRVGRSREKRRERYEVKLAADKILQIDRAVYARRAITMRIGACSGRAGCVWRRSRHMVR